MSILIGAFNLLSKLNKITKLYVGGLALFFLCMSFFVAKSFAQQYTTVGLTIVSGFTGELNFYTGDFVQINSQRYTNTTGVRVVLSSSDSSYYSLTGDILAPLGTGFGSGAYQEILTGILLSGDGSKTIDATLVRSGPVVETLELGQLDFILDQAAPTQPVLLAPGDSTVIYGARDFSREASVDAGVGVRYYTYSIATDTGMNTIVLANTTTQTGFSTNLNALGNGVYYWMVMVEDHLGNYINSEVWSFEVEQPGDGGVTPPNGEPRPSGGGSTIRYTMFDYCPDGDFSASYYDNLCSASEWVNTHPAAGDACAGEEDYGLELCLAYEYAYDNGITSMGSIDEADLYLPLLRKDFAKMVSQFAVHIVKLEPEVNTGCVFGDVENESQELQDFMKLSCELGLMGLKYDGVPNEIFWPNLPVSRAMFGTVLSRLLFGSIYNGNSSSWYGDHLEALKRADIMQYINAPLTSEVRGYAMLMLKRADEFGYVESDARRVSRYRRK